MTEEEAIKKLNDMDGGDPETAHVDADDVLLDIVMQHAPRVGIAYVDAMHRVGFWYA